MVKVLLIVFYSTICISFRTGNAKRQELVYNNAVKSFANFCIENKRKVQGSIMKTKYKMPLLLFVLSAVLLSGCGGRDDTIQDENSAAQQPDSISSSQEEESSVPIAFEGQDIEGNTVTSDIFGQSKLTMVNVWATYCNPCLSEMPGLGELAKEYDSEEFQLIGIISDVEEGADQETLDLAADLIAQTGADYPHMLLGESVFYAFLTDVSAVPTTFFIDENGEMIDTVVGAMEKSAWEEKINALLEE